MASFFLKKFTASEPQLFRSLPMISTTTRSLCTKTNDSDPVNSACPTDQDSLAEHDTLPNLENLKSSLASMRKIAWDLPRYHPMRREMIKAVYRHPFVENGPCWPFEMHEDNEALYVRADMPGVDSRAVKVWVDQNGFLHFAGEEAERIDLEYDNMERPRKFAGCFDLESKYTMSGFHLDKINAHMSKGLLRIVVPKIQMQKLLMVPYSSR